MVSILSSLSPHSAHSNQCYQSHLSTSLFKQFCQPCFSPRLSADLPRSYFLAFTPGSLQESGLHYPATPSPLCFRSAYHRFCYSPSGPEVQAVLPAPLLCYPLQTKVTRSHAPSQKSVVTQLLRTMAKSCFLCPDHSLLISQTLTCLCFLLPSSTKAHYSLKKIIKMLNL